MCTSACPTQDHSSWGECVRAKGLRINGCNVRGQDTSKQKAWDKTLDRFDAAAAQGVIPRSTTDTAITEALRFSDKTGVAFDSSVMG